MGKKNKKRQPKRMTPQQILANQQNAQLTKGPVTQEGKAVSSQNATTHGGYSMRHVLLDWEDPAEFDEFEDLILQHFNAQNALEWQHLEDYIWECWRAKRMRVFEAARLEQFSDPGDILAEMTKIAKIVNQIERRKEKALKAFFDYRNQLAETASPKRKPMSLAEIEAACRPPISEYELFQQILSRQNKNTDPSNSATSSPNHPVSEFNNPNMGSFLQNHS